MLRYFIKFQRNQKGEGEGTFIFIVMVILAIISGIFWFIGFIRETKHERVERTIRLREEEERKKMILAMEKHEPKGYLYVYKPGICGKEPCKITRPYFEEVHAKIKK
ncbi:MAG: hypothetical protein ACOX3T_02605 [Bdellovibrionota bacterium]